ncbi:ABC transporter permease [Halalkalicoccus jeotgali]|uniref:Binding-protein-dependent transport systems inner membrane component n=1 Tax=Halalkalicoccus jeotgali (strain DSM 18796 / CECT 7217 / JCM 14584 / KCTC 4019 / B3) TaxID=795797 RepID=D8JCZ2_HALJB|nr:ABC transporter permease [Halalkalicoccus jeotgali]ADJ16887.1 binding-protein-dependent transport systems inner membrane component [Halalkalicoccus jeotgali B3]ELY38677.1 binding-protein-dependent transport systems inner membrane component [Halalkalicoccus jeotgali B3]
MGTDGNQTEVLNSQPGTSHRFTVTDRLSKQLSEITGLLRANRMGQIGVTLLFVFVLMGLFGRYLAPHDPNAINRAADGSALRLMEPSLTHPLGTTNLGRDVASQVLVGARVSLLIGFLAAFVSVFIGVNIGLISGYFGGWVDDGLMRLADIAYGLPFLPFVLVLVFLLGPSLWSIVIVISLILWRSTARVIRSQVLSHKQRPYVESARAIGASDLRIMYRHILPNVLPLAFLYGSFSVAWAVIAEASISFLGFGDPSMTSWGQMLFDAYTAGAVRFAWWWVVPPGICIMLMVMSVFFIGRALEQLTNPELRHSE